MRCPFVLLVGLLGVLALADGVSAQTTPVLEYRFSNNTALPVVADSSVAANSATAGPLATLSTETPFAAVSLAVNKGTRSLDPSDPAATSTDPSGVATDANTLLSNAAINAAGGFTMECWFRWDGPQGFGLDVLIDYAGTEKLVVRHDGMICLKVSDGLYTTELGSAVVGQWHYVAAVFDTQGAALDPSGFQSGVVRGYVDSDLPTGPEMPVTVTTDGDNLSRPIAIGMHATGSFNESFNGRIFCPRVSLGVVTPANLLNNQVPADRSRTALTLNGTAEYTGGVLRLTPEENHIEGSAFTTQARPTIGHSFESFFSFRIVNTNNDGADGLTFIVQASEDGRHALGLGGGSLGLYGIEKNIAIAYDTFEGASDAIKFLQNGDSVVQSVAVPFTLNDGTLYYTWVDYDALAQTVDVYLATTAAKPATPTLTQTGVDLTAVTGPEAYFGFTAATGGLEESHAIESWMLTHDLVHVADECAVTAAPVAEGAWPFDTQLATTGTDPISASLCSGTNLGMFHKDAWFEYVASVTGDVRLSTCGSSFNTDLAVYAGACGSLVDIGCNGDSCAGNASEVVISAIAGESYYVRIGGSAPADAGPGLLRIDVVYPDECLDAPLFVGAGVWPFDTSAATTSFEIPPVSTCPSSLLGELHKDIWLTYEAGRTGDARISLCGTYFDTDLAVYEGDCASLVPLGCNGDACNGSGPGDPYASEVIVPVVAGESYFVRIGGWSSSQDGAGRGELTIEERHVDPAFVASYQVTGVITDIYHTAAQSFPDPISTFGSFDVGDTYSITFTYDTRVPATFSSSFNASFDDSLLSVHFELGGGGYSSSATSGRIFQRDSDFGDDFNLFNIPLDDHAGKSYAEAGFFDLIQLGDDEATLISDPAEILNPLPRLDQWEDRRMLLEFGEVLGAIGFDDPEYAIYGSITSIVRIGCELNKVVPATATGGDHNGISVAVDGDVAIGGAYKDNTTANDAGAAFIYRWNGTDWVEEQELLATDGAAFDFFGWSVDLDGDVAVVAAQTHDGVGPNSGAVYVFRNNGASWDFEQKLEASDAATDDEFGYRVAISGNAIVVGSRNDDANGIDSGSAYVFRHNGSSWIEEAKLLPIGGAAGDQFGSAVAIDGGRVVVGAPSTANGIAYVFEFDGACCWTEMAQLSAPGGAAGDSFGHAVTVSGDAIVVGAIGNDSAAAEAGAAYAFRYDGATWNSEGVLLPTLAEAGTGFGRSVSADGDRLAIGGAGFQVLGADSGAVQLYQYNGTQWVDTALLVAGDGAAGDNFGYSADLSDGFVITGAYRDDDAGTDTGSVYFFATPAALPPTLSCASGAPGTIEANWVNNSVYNEILVYVDGVLAQILPGDATTTIAGVDPALSHDVCLLATNLCSDDIAEVCCTVEPGTPFVRGDCNASGNLNIADAVAALTLLFSSGSTTCLDACDGNNDGSVNIADPVFVLGFLFSGGPDPDAPFPSCGVADLLGCDSFTCP